MHVRGDSKKTWSTCERYATTTLKWALNLLMFFVEPKDKPSTLQKHITGCHDFNFIYSEQTDRALATRRKNNSEIAQQVNQFFHDVDFDHTTTVDKACDYHKTFSQGQAF